MKLYKIIMNSLYNVKSWDDIKKIIVKSKNCEYYFNNFNGIDSFLGSGVYSKVFKIKDKNLTIKITTDSDEINGSALIFRKGERKRFVKIHNLEIVSDNLAFKIQDYLYPLTGLNIKAAKQLSNLFEKGKIKVINDKVEYMDYYDTLNKHAQLFLSELYDDFKKLDLIGLEFEDLDVKLENLLQDSKGKLILADF